MPRTITYDRTTLRPNYPNDRNAAGYFSHVKSRSIRDGAIYIPPTAGEWHRFARKIRIIPVVSEDNAVSAKEALMQVNLWTSLSIDPRTFGMRFRVNLGHTYGYHTNSVGTDAVQIIQTAFNMYVASKTAYGIRAHKVDYIHVTDNSFGNRQDDGFRGRCIFRLTNETITTLIIQMVDINLVGFWGSIFALYDQLAVDNYRITNPDYAARPTVTRIRRNTTTTTLDDVLGRQRAVEPGVRPVAITQEPAPNSRLGQEYLSRTIIDDSIPADQLAEMLRRTGNALSGEVRDMIYDLLMTDFNGSSR